MGNPKIISMLILLVMIPGTQVHALDENEFFYSIKVGKTYKWKGTINDVLPDKISFEFELSIYIHSFIENMVNYTYQEIITGGNIDTYNNRYGQDLSEGSFFEERITQHVNSFHGFFVSINDEYPSYYQENVSSANFTENLFSYKIVEKSTYSGSTGESRYELKKIYAKKNGL